MCDGLTFFGRSNFHIKTEKFNFKFRLFAIPLIFDIDCIINFIIFYIQIISKFNEETYEII